MVNLQPHMHPLKAMPLDSLAPHSSTPPPLTRRNLPRASQACQWCRSKKAKCDQQHPCSNCIRHSIDCVYGIRRRNGGSRNLQIQSHGHDQRSGTRSEAPFRSPASSHGQQSEQAGSDNVEQSRPSDQTVFPLQNPEVHDSDVVGDVNQHTQGTEFYGTSSNFVLFNQLFAFAKQHLPHGPASSGNSRNETLYLSPSSLGGNDQSSDHVDAGVWTREHGSGASQNSALPPGGMSIINLLSNNEALSPPSRPKTPPREVDSQMSGTRVPLTPLIRSMDGNHLPPISVQRSTPHLTMAEKSPNASAVRAAERRLEREFVRLFLSNLHYIHPMIDPRVFNARCEEEMWAEIRPAERKKDRRHFYALYNIVVAVGALVAGSSVSQEFAPDIKLCMDHSTSLDQYTKSNSSQQHVSSQALSRSYFRKSRVLLGDVFEVCSLESAQTLLLMSLYCQNSLKPHACYMYCGQAVRTALAIGLPSESMSKSPEARKAARRTWWCIYSHEIDMSCSSGRRDSLGKPRNYQVPLPCIREQVAEISSELEDKSVSMINEMVHFAAVLRRISKQIYHDSKGLTVSQKSVVAMEMDASLCDWKDRLPEWLDFNKICLREEESAAKQKPVLRLRYLNARILLHRPFLSVAMSSGQSSVHVQLCLDAARETIRVLYESYANRHYFRTWWYNSTYTLYAGMIILYIIMLGNTVVPSNELLEDVIKSRDILLSMEEATVARRSADLVREGLEVAKACIQQRQEFAAGHERSILDRHNNRSQGTEVASDANQNAEADFSRTFFSYAVPGQDPGALLASLIDPNLLQDFTAEINNMEFSTFPFEGSYPDWSSMDLNAIMQ